MPWLSLLSVIGIQLPWLLLHDGCCCCNDDKREQAQSHTGPQVHEAVGSWARVLDIHYSPVFKDHRRDCLPEASKYQHLVHEYGLVDRYDSEEARIALNHLWRAVDDRLNFFTPTRKPVTWVKDSSGQRKRIYDEPATPLDRLSEAGVMSPSQESELITYRNSLDPAQLTSEIGHWQERLKSISTL
ncbi:hypothetical protein [Brevibacterium aurantiacum]|uniref:hypothetical protein n=1 Tax=Brevibacterium aurantiacum TaxID=273384 RepID=UPI000FCAE517|nr:hypothetical protein [Brevibacterium aurantiacum]MDN5585583.1 hypothetical protein [Brevibacterium sp.]